MTDVVQRLKRIAARAARGEALGADGPWLANILDKLLAIEPGCMDVTFEEQAPLKPGWKKAYARDRQRQGIRVLAAHLQPHGNVADKVSALWSRFGRYRTSWRIADQQQASNPHTNGSQEFWLFEIFRAGAVLNYGNRRDLIPGPAQLRRILDAPDEPSY